MGNKKMRDRELVTDTERNRALVDIIENIKNCKIKLTTSFGESSVRETGKINNIIGQYKISLASPAIKGIETFTALNHECWHILFDSQFKIINRVLADWTDGTEMNKRMYYKFTLNLLEDIRIESLGGDSLRTSCGGFSFFNIFPLFSLIFSNLFPVPNHILPPNDSILISSNRLRVNL